MCVSLQRKLPLCVWVPQSWHYVDIDNSLYLNAHTLLTKLACLVPHSPFRGCSLHCQLQQSSFRRQAPDIINQNLTPTTTPAHSLTCVGAQTCSCQRKATLGSANEERNLFYNHLMDLHRLQMNILIPFFPHNPIWYSQNAFQDSDDPVCIKHTSIAPILILAGGKSGCSSPLIPSLFTVKFHLQTFLHAVLEDRRLLVCRQILLCAFDKHFCTHIVSVL